MKKIILIIWLFIQTGSVYAQLFINEFMASNAITISDESGEFDDWVEIYNASSSAIQLAGHYLTDDLNNPTKWAFPDISIPADGFLLIWTDGEINQGNLHASFKLSKADEQIGIFDGNGFLDSLSFSDQNADISYGRYPDGGSQWFLFYTPTPGTSNQSPPIEKTDNPSFSHPGGFYNDEIGLVLSHPSPEADVHYTLDYSEPSENSPLYSDPIVINNTAVVRARAFEPDKLPGDIVTHTYIYNSSLSMSVMSLVTDSLNLFQETGIYDNPNEREWERPVSIEYYGRDQAFGFRENGGLKIHGGSTRNFEKKPFRLYFRNEYGDNWLNYPLFASKSDMGQYKRLVLHSGGMDYPRDEELEYWTLLRNSLAQELYRRMNGIYCATHQTALYLNGLPWGIYTIIEGIDQYYIETNFNESDFDLIEKDQDGYFAKEGNVTVWEQMLQFFDENDLTTHENYVTAQALIDMDQFTDYNILEFYASNYDWPYNNQFMFRPRGEDGLWHWILWDMDRTLNFRPEAVFNNLLQYATSDEVIEYEEARNLYSSSKILVKLLENETYRIGFINRFMDLMNTVLLPLNARAVIDSLVMGIEQDITFETERWGSSPNEWRTNLDRRLRAFADERPGYLRDHIREQFGLGGTYQLTTRLADSHRGNIRVNSLIIDDTSWTGTYFSGVPIEVEAISHLGYTFMGWSDPTLPETTRVTLILNQNYDIEPFFEKDSVHYSVVINEINYNSAPEFDPEDWVELVNDSNEGIDISGWHFRDSDESHDFTIPPNTILPAAGYLVLCRDISAFRQSFPNVGCALGNFDFGLSNAGEWIGLLDEKGRVADSLKYDDQLPWPVEADGDGPTLALIDPALDNALAENWQAGLNYGTPCEPNVQIVQPYLSFYPDTLRFFSIVGSGELEVQTVTVINTRGGSLQWTAQENPDAVWMRLSNTSGGTGDRLMVYVDVTGLNEGVYTGFVRITDPNAENSPMDVTVIVHVVTAPILSASPDSLFFIAMEAHENPPDQDITVTNVGSGVLSWTAFEKVDRSWMGLMDSSGGSGDKTQVSVDVNDLSAGNYTNFVEIRDPNAINSPIEVYIELVITPRSEVQIETAILDSGVVGDFYADTLRAVGGILPYHWEVYEGALPFGLSLNEASGIISGTPTMAEHFFFRIRVTDTFATPNEDIELFSILVKTKNSIADPDMTIDRTMLFQNTPNPFNEATAIHYHLSQPGHVVVTIYDLLGQRVRTLLDENQAPGRYTIRWDGRDDKRQLQTSGIYIYEMRTKHFRKRLKFSFLK